MALPKSITQQRTNLIWTMFSFGIMAVSGLAINVAIGRFFAPNELGAFNQVFALFLILSQLSTLGIHYSVGRYLPQVLHEQENEATLIVSSVVTVAFFSTIVAILSGLLAKQMGFFFNSPDVEKMWLLTWPALILFSVNKVIFSIINSKQLMRLYSIAQSVRYILLLLVVSVIGFLDFSAINLGYSFLISEFFVFLIILPSGLKLSHIKYLKHSKLWLKEHLRFGFFSMLSGAVLELNSRVDILILGYFMSDAKVGVYSIALLIAEGLMQISTAIRVNINPEVSRMHKHDRVNLWAYLRTQIKFSYIVFIPFFVLALGLYAPAIKYIFGDSYVDSVIPFYILLTFVFLSFGFLPLSMFLLQTGKPKRNTMVQIIVLLVNVSGNFLLIPYFGLIGAAVGTGLSIIVNSLLIYGHLSIDSRVG